MILNFSYVGHVKPNLVIFCFERLHLIFSNAYVLLNLVCNENVYSNLFVLCSASCGKLMDCITYSTELTD